MKCRKLNNSQLSVVCDEKDIEGVDISIQLPNDKIVLFQQRNETNTIDLCFDPLDQDISIGVGIFANNQVTISYDI